MPRSSTSSARISLVSIGLALSFGCKDRGPAKPEAKPEPWAEAMPEAKAPTEPDEEEPKTKEPALPRVSEAATATAAEVDAARYEADLRFIAAVRPPGSDHWQAVQDRCADVLGGAGFETERFTADGAGVSVVGRKTGTDPSLPMIVVGAHYDHIEDCAGADDNASGAAAVLELARVLGGHSWPRTLTVACWDEEENGLFGSRAWADAAVARHEAIAWYLNFDAIAYADSTPNSQTLPPGVDIMFAKQIASLKRRELRADFIAVLADEGAHGPSSLLRAHAAALGLPELLVEIPVGLVNEPMLADLRRSDHASFWRHDIPAVFLSDTANFRTDTYHCGSRPDTVETLDLTFATTVVRAAAGGLAEELILADSLEAQRL